MAQHVSMRLGGLHARYADSITGQAASLGARASWTGNRSRGVAEASWAQFTTGEGALQGWIDVALLAFTSGGTGFGLGAQGVANSSGGGTWSAAGSAEVFGVRQMGGFSLGLALSAGGVRSFTLGRRPIAGALARLSFEADSELVLVTTLAGTVSRGIRYADFTIAGDWKRGRWSGGALVGTRQGDLDQRRWVQGWGGWAMTPWSTLEISAGSYPMELSGYQHGAFIQFGVRLALRAPRPRATQGAIIAGLITGDARRAPVPVPANPNLLVESLGDSVRVTFRFPPVALSGIVGEWNEWTAQPLQGDNAGSWTATLPLKPGTWRFALVTFDGTWIVPEGVVKIPDDFGGETGVLVIR